MGRDGTFLVAATRLGGYHGYDEAGAQAPLGGAVTGFTKAYARERPDLLAKAVDFAASKKTATLADALIEETLTDPGAVEIGRAGGRRWTVGLSEVPFGTGSDGAAWPSARTPCSPSQGRQAQSCRPSSRIWPRPVAAAASTCST